MISKIYLCICVLLLSEAVFAAAIEWSAYPADIDPLPTMPATSDEFRLEVVDTLGCILGVTTNAILIDSANRVVRVSLEIPILGTPTCPGGVNVSHTVPIGFLEKSGTYSISVYVEDAAQSGPFQNLIGSFQLVVGDASSLFRLENPSPGSIQSGVGLISGWACDARTLEVSIDGSPRVPVAYGNLRSDTQSVCGDSNNGFAKTQSWGALNEGIHRIQTYVDDQLISNIEIVVAGLGQSFTKGLEGAYTLEDFPSPGESVIVEWSEPLQNFIIINRVD